MKRILFLLMLCLTITSYAQTNTWTGAGANTNWNTVANWSLNAVPTAANDVVIPTGFTVNLNVGGTTKSIVVQGSSTFNIASSLSFTNASSFGVNTNIIFSSGNLNGGGTLTNNGIMTITSTSYKYIYGDTVLSNTGTMNFVGTGAFFITNGILNNQSNGIIDMQAENANISYSGGSLHILNNYGIIKRTTSTGVANISAGLQNDGGTISVQTGSLTLDNSSIKLTNGTYNVSTDASLNWVSTVTCEGVLTGSLNGQINWNGTVNVPVGVTFNFSGSTGVNWTGGTLSGGGTLTNQSEITLLSSSYKYFHDNTFLNNESNFNIESSGALFLTNGTFNNQSTGIIALSVNDANISYSGGSTHVLNNEGLIKQNIIAGTGYIQVVLNNNGGTILVENGDLSFYGLTKYLNSGTYNVSTAASLQWNSKTVLSGTLIGVLDGPISWNNIVNLPEGSMATFNFTGSSGVNWTAGNLDGGGTLINKSKITLLSTSYKYFYDNTLLNNEGSFNIESSGSLFITNGTFNNQLSGVIELKVDNSTISYSGGSTHILNNYGLIKQGPTTENCYINALLNNNDGTILVESGNLNFTGLTKNLNDGVYNVDSDASLQWNSQTVLSGTLTGILDGAISWNNEVNVPEDNTATFNFTGDTGVNWTAGNLRGGGTLINQSEITLLSTSYKYFYENTLLNNEGNFNIESSGALFITNGTFNNQTSGIIELRADGSTISFSGGSRHILNNSGLIKQSLPTGTCYISALLNNNDGTISVESGILSFETLVKNLNDGIYNISTGASLQWSSEIVPSGTLTGILDGAISWNNIVNVPITTTATFNFTGDTGVNWTIGNLKGGGTLINESEITLLSSSYKYINDDTTLNNTGFINLEGTGAFFVTNGIINNQATGVIDLISDNADISYSGGSTHILNNFGLLKKSAGSGSSYVSVTTTTNSGTIDAQSGTLNFVDGRNLINTQDGIIKGIATLDIPGAANFTNDGTFAPGGSPGTLTVLGVYKSSTTSVLDVELNGLTQGTQYDLLAITGTNAIFEGIVNVDLGFEANVGDSFTIATVSGVIATKNLVSPIYGEYDCKKYTFNITYPNDKNVLLTISAKADVLPPDVITQDITVQLNASGMATILPSQINNGSSDNCTLSENLIFALDTSSFSCANIGANTVNLTVTDEAGNSASATATVTVEDLMNPVVSCPGDLSVTGETIFVLPDYYDINVVTASDNCAVTSVVQDPAPGTELSAGVTIITITAHDSSGNTAVCTFELEVTLSIADFEQLDAQVLLYPNPVSDSFTIKNSSHINLVSASIVDVKGSVIQEINLKDMGENKTISIQDYASGVYFVKIYSETSSSVKRIIKL